MNTKIIKEIKERIKQEGNLNEIVELSLEDMQITAITKEIGQLLRKAKNLEILMLNDNDLENIDNLPDLELTALHLRNNRITDAALTRIGSFSDLGQLVLSGNQIQTLEGIKPLFKLQKLMELDLTDNPVAELPGYRELIFQQIPGLQILDHADKDGNDVSLDSEDQEEDSEDDFDSNENDEESEAGGHSQNLNNNQKPDKK